MVHLTLDVLDCICYYNTACSEIHDAIGNVCTHVGGPLAEGKLEGYEVQCPWHGSKFDIRTGKVVRPPAMRAEPTYEVKVEENNILIENKKG